MSKVVLISPYIIPRRIDFYNKIYHRFKSEGTNFEVIIIKKNQFIESIKIILNL